MKTEDLKRYLIYGQLGVWFLLFLLNFLFEIDFESPLKAIFYAFTSTFFLVPIVYIHFIYLIPILIKKKVGKYVFLTSLLITICILGYYGLDSLVSSDYEGGDEIHISIFIYDFIMAMAIIALSSLYYFVDDWIKNFNRESQLKQEKLQTELSLLKSQINPHFLFNTLNNIYSYTQTGNKKGPEMIEKLSSILRYMVYEGSADHVQLLHEKQAIQDLLDIQKMKNSKEQNISFETHGIKAFHLVSPLIMVNFVENACKHSDVTNNPNGYLHIKLEVDENDLCTLQIENSFGEKNSIETKYQGVGNANIKKRIELQYGENYQLEEELSNGEYTLKLIIPLERKQ